MAGLSFLAVSCMAMILNAARGLAGKRRVILRCPSEIANRFVLLGAAGLAGVSVVTTHDR